MDVMDRNYSCCEIVCFSVVVIVSTSFIACGNTSNDSLVTIDGSSTVFPITEAVAEEFQHVSPSVRITVGVSGTGGGFKKFCAGEIDITNASRAIKQVEIDACADAGIDVIEVPIAYDGIAIVVNPKNDWVEELTVDDLKKIWEPASQQTITKWKQIKESWPDRELHLFGPGVDSGTFDYFTDVIVGNEGASRGDFTSSEDDNVLVQGISTDELALGFFGYAYYEENQHRLKIIGVDDNNDDNGIEAVIASPESVRDGTYQPLSRPIFIYLSVASLRKPNVKEFVDFYLSGGTQSLIREVGYVPLSEDDYKISRNLVGSQLLE